MVAVLEDLLVESGLLGLFVAVTWLGLRIVAKAVRAGVGGVRRSGASAPRTRKPDRAAA